jgi:hypothetical protein
MASPSSPVLHKSHSLTPDAAVNISSKLRRNSLVSDHEDMLLLREKLTRIAVGRRRPDVADDEAMEEDPDDTNERTRRRVAPNEHFKVFPLLPPERPSTPPSSPQPRDVLRKQLRLKQAASCRIQRRGSVDDGGLDAMVSVDEVEITPMEDVDASNAVHSPTTPRRSPQARLSIPGHLRGRSPFGVLNKYPEGLRKRKSVHVDTAEDEEEPRASLKKTSSQINILASSGKLSRSSSAGGALFQNFAARQRREQNQDMEDAPGCTTQPQSPQSSIFGNKHGRLSACS